MIEALYVIGNGFDKAHGIPSGYPDFRDYCEQNIPDLYGKLERYYPDPDELWTDFEVNLKNLDADMLIDWCKIGNEGWNTGYKEFYRFVDGVKDEVDNVQLSINTGFQEWIHSLQVDGLDKVVGLYLPNTMFLNFNYTKTLEKLYKVPEYCINHIHGISETGAEQLVFGHNATNREIELETEGDNDLENEARKEIANLIAGLAKPTANIIDENKDFFDKISGVKMVVCLGISYNDIDMPYYKAIRQSVSDDALWICSAYSDDDKQRLKEFKEKLDIKNLQQTKIERFDDPRLQPALTL